MILFKIFNFFKKGIKYDPSLLKSTWDQLNLKYRPDEISYLIYLKTCSTMQLVDEAEEKFDEIFYATTNMMPQSSPNKEVKGMGNDYEATETQQVNLPMKCISVMLQLYTKINSFEKSIKLIEQINEMGFTWNISYINALIKMYGETGQLEEIENLINNVDSMGIKPDRQFYSSIIEAYASHGDFEYVETMLENLKSTGMMINKEILHKLIFLYSKAHNWKQVQYCLDLFQIQKFKTNIDTFEALMRGRLEVI
jgi:pentatricopeptide repeat protein